MTNSTAAIILSGGSGKRMAGADKGLQRYLGRCLIEHVVDAVAPQVEQLIISVNRNKSEYAQFKHPVITDNVPLYQGPMAGIVAAIKHIQQHPEYQDCDFILTTSCDTPNLPANFLSKLCAELGGGNGLVAVVNDGKRNQNLHCLIHRDARQSLLDFYTDGGRAMHRWLKQIEATEVDFSDQADAFTNINTLEQLGNAKDEA